LALFGTIGLAGAAILASSPAPTRVKRVCCRLTLPSLPVLTLLLMMLASIVLRPVLAGLPDKVSTVLGQTGTAVLFLSIYPLLTWLLAEFFARKFATLSLTPR
jgi:hypothetical protein